MNENGDLKCIRKPKKSRLSLTHKLRLLTSKFYRFLSAIVQAKT